ANSPCLTFGGQFFERHAFFHRPDRERLVFREREVVAQVADRVRRVFFADLRLVGDDFVPQFVRRWGREFFRPVRVFGFGAVRRAFGRGLAIRGGVAGYGHFFAFDQHRPAFDDTPERGLAGTTFRRDEFRVFTRVRNVRVADRAGVRRDGRHDAAATVAAFHGVGAFVRPDRVVRLFTELFPGFGAEDFF